MTTPREVFTAFLTQACCGTIVALHRMGNTEIVTYKEQLVFMLTGYFNNCWNFLLSGGDAYVVESFEMMKHDNPSCVIRHLFSIGASILPDEPPLEIVCVTPDNVEALEAARMAISKTLHQLIMDSTTDELFLHTCEGLSLNEERAIWVEKGRPTVAFFEVSS
ncbi:unnamed protein product [Trypanosoma congolense IL3000]|uniref:Uncharacterized protein n=1 Tax=Trypanosoma congolense (strain IL3000) TaxID=1068625 RepID=F9WGK8_TRYCI|nr:conserved hypothetical protein [Trypanosoma congolense IL3000]CCD16445.1 unnamed protein product [Trypanosoma congolense IL3000]